jgi:hypothetical protein
MLPKDLAAARDLHSGQSRTARRFGESCRGCVTCKGARSSSRRINRRRARSSNRRVNNRRAKSSSRKANSRRARSRFAEPIATEQEAAVAEQIHHSLESPDKVSPGMRGTLRAWTIPLRFILNPLESEALITDTALAILRLVSYLTSCL